MQPPRTPLSTVPHRSTSLRAPVLLGQYHVLGEIGRSAVGPLHLARLEGTQGFQRWAAVRRVDAIQARDSVFMAEFFERARQGAALLHPNVAALFDVGENDGTAWLATEHLLGERIEEVIGRVQLADTPVSWDLAARIVADAAEGLHAVHCHTRPDGSPMGLLHGDVAPHSIVVTYDGTTKIKGAFEPRARGTLDRRKLPYAAPEQIWSEPVDARTDVFALGVILWELCSGQRLFARETDDETRAMVEAGDVPPLGEEIAGFPTEIDVVTRRALAPRKQDRFSTARELSRALESALVARGVLVRSDDVATYMRALFADAYAEREGMLRDASDVTEVFRKSRHLARLPLREVNAPDLDTEFTVVNDAPTARRGPAGSPSEAIDDLARTQERPPRTPTPTPLPPVHTRPVNAALPEMLLRPAPALMVPHTHSLTARAKLPDGPDARSQVFVKPSDHPNRPTANDPSYVSRMTPLAPFDLREMEPVAAAQEFGAPQEFSHSDLGSEPAIPLGPRIMPARPAARPRIATSGRSASVRAALLGGGIGLVLFLVFIGVVRTLTPSQLPTVAAPASADRPPMAMATATTQRAGTSPTPSATPPPVVATIAVLPPLPASKEASSPPPVAPPAPQPPPHTPTVSVSSLPVSAPKTSRPQSPPAPPAPPAPLGQLTVICVPVCSDVLDGGRSLGPSPLFKQSLPAGRHQITLRGENGSRKVVSVEVIAGENTRIRPAM